MTEHLMQGARNCVVDCGGVKRSTRLFVVSERGAVEPEVVAAIAATGREVQATVVEVWGDTIPKETPGQVPPDVLAAYRDADVVISHYPSLRREVLFEHFGNETRVRVPNRARTVAMLSSDWARFPYTLQRTVADRLDAAMTPGTPWRVTSPSGTDMSGVFADARSEVGAAFFVDTEDGRARRNFPGGVHNPHNSSPVDGTLVVDYTDNVAQSPADDPFRLEIRHGRVVSCTGGDKAGLMRKKVEASDGWIDSWHAGVHPRTLTPVDRTANAREWFSYCHCSPQWLHFHLGRTHDTLNLACYEPSIALGGRPVYDRGRIRIWDDEPIAAARAATRAPAQFLDNLPLPLW